MRSRIVVLPLRHTVAWRDVAFVVFDAAAVDAFVLDAFEITLVQVDATSSSSSAFGQVPPASSVKQCPPRRS